MIKVFISSPYTIGDTAFNVRRQMDATDELIERGYAPFTPLYYHFQHIVHPRHYDDWIKIDLEWLRSCDCVLRLPGESKGADIECAEADRLGLTVFNSVADIVSYYG